jgi:hypothetical protein
LRFLHPAAGSTEADHDSFTEKVIAEIRNSGEAFFQRYYLAQQKVYARLGD